MKTLPRLRLEWYVYLFVLIFAPVVHAGAKDISTLLAFETSPIGDRIPLILVHGYLGNQWDNGVDDVASPHWPYWQTVQNFYYNWDLSGIKDKYKLYAFFTKAIKSLLGTPGRESISHEVCATGLTKGRASQKVVPTNSRILHL
jgi:hypothetical protein